MSLVGEGICSRISWSSPSVPSSVAATTGNKSRPSARTRHDWLKKYLRLPNGVPSHDTFERVFDRIDPAAFQACFRDWMQALHDALGLSQIAIDGKTLRGSGVGGRQTLHLVSAWATANCLSLGQVAVAEKSNEITAIPRLLELLDVNGALVSIDAMGCQRDIVAKIVERGGDYVLTVKDNQPSLLAAIQACFENAIESDFAGLTHDEFQTQETGHGRVETRSYQIITDPALPTTVEWKGLTTIGVCYHECTCDGKTTEQLRYFIGSRRTTAKVYGTALRHHWAIENTLHCVLPASLHESIPADLLGWWSSFRRTTMGTSERGELPTDLARGRSRFQAWRGLRQAGDRIPQRLWALAVRLVSPHGVSRTATALGLDYYTLKKRAEQAADQPVSSGPAFVELPSPVVVGKQCLFELDNGAGATMRVQLVGYDAADVAALSRSFWNAE